MKKIILVSAFAMLAACGSTKSGVSVDTATGQTSASPAGGSAASPVDTTATSDTTAGSDDTINVDNFGDMPPKCIALFTGFLKKLEPEATKIDWTKATIGEFQTFMGNFQADSDAFDAQSTAAGCDKYNLDATDKKIFDQIIEVAAVDAPGAVGLLTFIGSLNDAATTGSGSGSVPADCAGTIAAIEPFLARGGTTKDLTPAQAAELTALMGGIGSNCTEKERADFFARPDATAFFADG